MSPEAEWAVKWAVDWVVEGEMGEMGRAQAQEASLYRVRAQEAGVLAARHAGRQVEAHLGRHVVQDRIEQARAQGLTQEGPTPGDLARPQAAIHLEVHEEMVATAGAQASLAESTLREGPGQLAQSALLHRIADAWSIEDR